MCTTALGVVGATHSEPAFQWLVRRWIAGLAEGMRFEARGVGTEKLSRGRPYVYMANHQSFLDILALFRTLPLPIGFLAKKEIRSVPLLGPVMDIGGHVFVDRKHHDSAMQAMAGAAEQVRGGKALVIFPEGTRGDGVQLQRFKSGGFHLAMQAGVPLVPVGIRGTSALMSRDEYLPRSGSVEVHVGEPLDAASFADVGALSDTVRTQISQLSGLPLS